MIHRRLGGFTLVELLVVIAIIAILVMLLLPSINAMREAARRTSCVNKMGQLITAVANYEMSHSVYPPGVTDDTGPILNQAQGLHYSWTVALLPFLEEDNLYNSIDHKVGVYHANNEEVRGSQVSVFVCPSSVSGGGASDYAACHHDIEAPIDANNSGTFFLNSRLGHDDIRDGTAYTLFLGEKHFDAASDLGWMSGTRATLRNTGTAINGTRSVESLVSPAAPKGVADAAADARLDLWRRGLYVGGFGSDHVGGAVFAFGDGHVSFMPDSTDLRLLQRLGNRADGQVISGSELER
jgi:prepilin-type N-terminal cleavage/methylation domain-containing protein